MDLLTISRTDTQVLRLLCGRELFALRVSGKCLPPSSPLDGSQQSVRASTGARRAQRRQIAARARLGTTVANCLGAPPALHASTSRDPIPSGPRCDLRGANDERGAALRETQDSEAGYGGGEP